MKCCSFVLACAVLFASASQAEVPPPSATPAHVITSGPTTTAVDIKIVKVGQQIPKTYAGTKIHNTPGFEFYVSQHYALKSSRGDDYSKMMLEVAELAYPHWVELVGAAPPDPETRMYFVCAKEGKQMIEAMKSDVGMGTAGGFGGGITIYTNHSAYNYESGTLRYHQRALVIHENLHMLQMIVHGTGGSEGFTYSGEQHVYDPAKKQLTVMCFDKPTINNHTDAGLAALRKDPVSMSTALDTLWNTGGGPGVVYTQFLWRDPDRWLKWCIWRDEYYAGRLNWEPNSRLMEDIFGPLDKLGTAWETWVKQKRNSFHFVDWGWEQDGNALWAYGFPRDGKFWSQTDLNYAPREKVEYDPLRMDYPAEPMPTLVGPVERGVPEPSVGYLIDFSRGPGCWGGFGLGVEERSMCQVVLVQGRTLVIDGKDFGIARQEIPLSEDLIKMAKANGLHYGVTIGIRQKALEVTVRAGKPENVRETKASVPIDEAQRERLMSRHMAVIGKAGYPVITPFIDDARKLPPDLTAAAAANFWRFDGLNQLETLYKAAWRLKDYAPKSLLNLKAEMLSAVDNDPGIQAKAITAYEDRILAVVQDVRACAADQHSVALALGDLTGTTIFSGPVEQGETPDRVKKTIKLIARLKDQVAGTVTFTASPKMAGPLPKRQEFLLASYQPKTVSADLQFAVPLEPTTLTTIVELHWRGQKIAIPITQVLGNTAIPRWAVIGPFNNPGGATADVQHPIETEAINLSKKYPGQDGQIGWRKVESLANTPALAEHVVDFNQLFGAKANAAAYALAWLDSDHAQDAVLALGSDDGAIVWLNDKQLHKNLLPRGYVAQSDRVPIHLNQGSNKLLVKITQGDGAWSFGAQLLRPDGSFLPGVKCSVGPILGNR